MFDLLVSLLSHPGMETFVNDHAWPWAVAEIVHFFGMSMLFGTVGALDLRMMGFAKGIPVGALEKMVPVGIFGFVLCFLSGLVFLTGRSGGPTGYLLNFPFQAKMVLMALAGVNVGIFYLTGISKAADATGASKDVPAAAKVIGTLSFFMWVGVIYFGRMIMYADRWEDVFHF